jgi:hypothetical protein
MSESFFGNYGVTADEVNENPFSIPHNTYDVVVGAAEVKSFKKNPDIEYFTIEYQIAKGPEAGKTAQKMFRMKPLTAADSETYQTQNARTTSNFKKELMNLGLTEAQINGFNPRVHGTKLVGIRGQAVMGPQKGNEEYNSISNFTRAGTADDSENVSSESEGVANGTAADSEDGITSLLGDGW